ncbi:MAG: 3-demethylubiquinone-9 3-O-methyltransferase [Candidatus Aminicenantes bacterium RBG_16_63_16]|nr:MAG: 3-demethylubiquinone-9 3-O-methyltransferase [Candidatus Aminicenantes bacterium RBG_16_63_16]
MDNDLYSARSDEWWESDSPFYQMKVSFNPARVGYVRRVLFDVLKIDPSGRKALEVGSGGGYVSEEIARLGYETTGIDPSGRSVEAAAAHARAGGLSIRYLRAVGESLPFEDTSHDVVLCCDVLEHVRDLPKVISEVARVLRPGAPFFYNTINRTLASRLAVIQVSQEWRRWAFLPPGTHEWRMFIKPGELRTLLSLNRLEWKENRGLVPDISIPRVLSSLRRRARGEWTYVDLSRRIGLVESRFLGGMYVGYAVKDV